MTGEHQSRAHATLGASSAHRWMNCPGSVRLSVDAPRRSSKYADEGTAAHQLAEKCLHRDAALPDGHARDFLGTAESVNDTDWPVTEEMAESVQVFLDTIRAQIEPGDTLVVEQRFDLSALYPGMFGTNDACVVAQSRGTLFVNDYKHGKGHAVEAVGNPQLRYYGLGALMTLGLTGIHTIVLTIVQPRAPHRDGPVRSETISALDLLEWTTGLKAAAKATEDVFAPVKAGEWCTFCPAAGSCPALRDASLEAAMADFAGATIKVPTDPAILDNAQLGRLLDGADLIDTWISAVRAHALHLAESGQDVPGYKLVDKRATRRWRDTGEVPQSLSAFGFTRDDIYGEAPLLSPAQIEAKMDKTHGKNAKERAAKLEPLVERVSSGRNLVRGSDPRPAQTASAVADFADIQITP